MSLAVTLTDETTSGEVTGKTTLKLVSERITLRELITQRIREEVDEFNRKQTEQVFNGLVQPSDTEKALNGYKFTKQRLVDFDKQLDLAIRAFESNGYFVLLNDTQIDDLNKPLTLTEQSKVSFIKLVPLVGG